MFEIEGMWWKEVNPLADTLSPGDIILVALPAHQPKGREQEGKRPALVVGIPPGEVRYLVVLIAPLTTQAGEWTQRNPAIYPKLVAGTGGLSQDSVVLLDQIRAIDARRITAYLGTLTSEEYAPILKGIQQILGIKTME